MHLKSVYHKSGWLCTRYQAGAIYDGSEGELYDMTKDPEQRVNLWDDPGSAEQKQFLLKLIEERFPKPREPRLERMAPV